MIPSLFPNIYIYNLAFRIYKYNFVQIIIEEYVVHFGFQILKLAFFLESLVVNRFFLKNNLLAVIN
jgi:hypothetical protein